MRRGTEIHVVNGEDVARRQLSQWQCKVQFGEPSYWKVIAPHRHLPSTAFKSRALPAAMEVATLPLAAFGVNGSGSTIASPCPNSAALLLFGRIDIWTQRRWPRQPAERCLWWWDQAVGPSGVGQVVWAKWCGPSVPSGVGKDVLSNHVPLSGSADRLAQTILAARCC